MLFVQFVYGQSSKIDSLQGLLNDAKDEERTLILLRLSKEIFKDQPKIAMSYMYRKKATSTRHLNITTKHLFYYSQLKIKQKKHWF